MDPTEIIKHIPEALSVAKVAAASIPFTAIVKRMLGDASDEVAKQLADEIKVYRYGRSLKLLEKAEGMAKDAGFTPRAVPIKLLFPLLEGASLEEDENLHDMWAALLANAASPENAEKVRPGFIATLKQMAPDEAVTLKWLNDQRCEKRSGIDLWEIRSAYESFGLTGSELETCLNGLEANRLIHGHDEVEIETDDSPLDPYLINEGIGSYTVTDRGRAFVESCGPPKPRS